MSKSSAHALHLCHPLENDNKLPQKHPLSTAASHNTRPTDHPATRTNIKLCCHELLDKAPQAKQTSLAMQNPTPPTEYLHATLHTSNVRFHCASNSPTDKQKRHADKSSIVNRKFPRGVHT